jgi:hypothetical protein
MTTDITASSIPSCSPAVGVIINGSTWILPFDCSMAIPQTDGSTVTVGPKKVQVGSRTFAVSSANQEATLSTVEPSATIQLRPIMRLPADEIAPIVGRVQGQANAIAFMLSEAIAVGSS